MHCLWCLNFFAFEIFLLADWSVLQSCKMQITPQRFADKPMQIKERKDYKLWKGKNMNCSSRVQDSWVILVNLRSVGAERLPFSGELWSAAPFLNGFLLSKQKSHQQFTPAANLCSCKCICTWCVVIHTGVELLMESDCFEVSGRAWLLLDLLPPPVFCPL